VAVNEVATGRWFSVAEAATRLGVPQRAIYRGIATQALRARRDSHGVLLVCLDDQTRLASQTNGVVQEVTPNSALTPDRARALTEFASGLMGPLVSRLAQQEAIIREQAEELGRLRARMEGASETENRLAPAFARQIAELAAIREEIERLADRPRWWPFG